MPHRRGDGDKIGAGGARHRRGKFLRCRRARGLLSMARRAEKGGRCARIMLAWLKARKYIARDLAIYVLARA